MRDVLLLSSSEELARRSLGMLISGEGTSKFDDPRLQAALQRLPQPEDSLVFYDGKLHFSQMRKLVDFIRQAGQNDAQAGRVADILESVFDEVSIIDYQVTVEYTEGNLNRSASFGRLLPGSEGKLLFKAVAAGQPFENWQSWVPAESLSYSLQTGVNLHTLYEGVVQLIRDRIPEAQSGLEKFEQLQSEWDVHIDRDILQAFSGEFVSVSLPAATPQTFGGADSVLALRCQKPERIGNCSNGCSGGSKNCPRSKCSNCSSRHVRNSRDSIISVNMLAMLGVKPVIGFHDDWMLIGSNSAAVRKVLDTRAGQGKTIVGPKRTRSSSSRLRGPWRRSAIRTWPRVSVRPPQPLTRSVPCYPWRFAFAGANANAEELKPVQEAVALLPLVSQIVAKFDFLEARMSVNQSGGEPGTFLIRGVTVVRPAATQSPESR